MTHTFGSEHDQRPLRGVANTDPLLLALVKAQLGVTVVRNRIEDQKVSRCCNE